MRVKCGRKEYEITEKDYILSNGACYQLILHKNMVTPISVSSPIVSKSLFNKLLKENKIIEFEPKEGYASCSYFKFRTKAD